MSVEKNKPAAAAPRAAVTDAGWFARPYGRRILAEESALCKDFIRGSLGACGVQLGGNRFLLRHARLRHKWWAKRAASGSDIVADCAALPFDSETMDAVVVVHALESSSRPHDVVREAVRVLRPEGRLLIIGFNPYSMLSLASGAPYRRRWISVWRLKDWLKLLETAPQASAYAAFLPPWKSLYKSRLCRWLEPAGRRWLPFTGGVYMIAVTKRQIPMTLIPPITLRPPKPATA